MCRKNSKDIFLLNQKIPSVLDEYFHEYTQTGDYSMLLNKTKLYIRQDRSDKKEIIHNLKFEKNKIDARINNNNSMSAPAIAGVSASITTVFLTTILNQLFKNELKTFDTLYVLLCYAAFVVLLLLISKVIAENVTDDVIRVQKKHYLNFCIEEYCMLNNQSTS